MDDTKPIRIKYMKTLFFDIETNEIEDWTNLSDLEAVHCLSIYEPMNAKMVTYHGDGIQNGLRELAKADRICGHNIIGFDLPVLSKLYGFAPPLIRLLDTMVMAKCIHPDVRNDDFMRSKFDKKLVGSHSLKAWGIRLSKLTKLTYGEEDGAFDSYNEELRKYCERDVIVTHLLFDYLMKQQPSGEMLALEHWFAFLMRLQEKQGFAFDIDKAEKLELKLASKRADLLDKLQREFPSKQEEMKTPSGWSLEIKRDDGVEIICGVTKVQLKEELKSRGLKQTLLKQAVKMAPKTKTTVFNPGSRKQIAERFSELGFDLPIEPDAKTPKVDEAVLRSIDHPFAEVLCDYLLVTKRLGQLAEGNQAWLKLQKNGRIHGRVNTNGAVTGRCTHQNPNVAQVPACRAEYGEECRELFKAGEGYKLVGCDAAGLELRMLAHYLAFYDRGAYAKTVVEGDIHTLNQQAAGLETRDQAKTFIYAFLYGAGDAKIGEIVGGSAKEGQMLKRKFLNNLPALKRLQADVQRKVEAEGKLVGLDGRILPVRSSHSALNMLLQSAGAVCMKVALIQLFHKMNSLNWQHGREYSFVANVHDEFQAEVLPEKAQQFGDLAVLAIAAAGVELKLNVMLDGEAKIGESWAQTH
jgi:DNA polymerase I-like protein with 3'-5' exonuclease and polymerase domains